MYEWVIGTVNLCWLWLGDDLPTLITHSKLEVLNYVRFTWVVFLCGVLDWGLNLVCF